jgi:hypothetical protein
MLDLSLIWAGLIATAVLLYVTLDGFDLGIGILFPFAKSKEDRDVMMNTVAPVWDGNETWLVLGGGGLLAAFPLAYSVLMPAFYLPVLLMLLERAGIVTRTQLKAGRRYAIVAAFAIAAVLTPPDVWSQFALAIPLILLYEISIIGIWFTERSRARAETPAGNSPA